MPACTLISWAIIPRTLFGGVGEDAGEGERADRVGRYPLGQLRVNKMGKGKKRLHVESGNRQQAAKTRPLTGWHADGDGWAEPKGGGWA